MIKTLIAKARKKAKEGFTLIELIVVIAILGILAAILIPSVTSIVGSAQIKTDTANAKTAYMQTQVLLAQDAASTIIYSTAGENSALELAVKNAANITTGKIYITIGSTADTVSDYAFQTAAGKTYDKNGSSHAAIATGLGS
jgi:prepilin-type N-terminal cleavage/methylation domain-containing protein